MDTLAHVEIDNWKGIVKASFDIPKKGVVLVGGANEAGKSSTLEAIAYTLTGATMDTAFKRTRNGNGGKTKVVISQSDESYARLVLPTGKRETSEWGIRLSPLVAGIDGIKVTQLNHKKRLALFGSHLQSEPEAKDLYRFLKVHGWKEEDSNKVFQQIKDGGKESGWEKRHAVAEKQRASLKGQWQECVGGTMSWGSDQSEGWFPENWDKELAKMSEDSLREEVTTAKQNLEAQVASKAVDQEQVAKLHEQWLGKEELIAQVEAKKEELAKAEIGLKLQREKYAAIPELKLVPPPAAPVKPTYETMDCLGCQKKHWKVKGEWVGEEPKVPAPAAPPAGPTKEAVEANRVERQAAQELGTAAKNVRDNLQKELGALEHELDKANTAHNAWIEMIKNEGGSTDEQIEEAREAVKSCEQRLKAFTTWQRATKLHKDILTEDALCKALQPEGVRLEKMKKAVSDFNEQHLTPICELAGWGSVELHHDMTITYQGKDIDPLCDSEKHRLDVTFQAAMAHLDKSDLLLIDRLELLTEESRNQLIDLLETLDIPAVCARAVDYPSDMPDLDGLGLGQSYWVEKGKLKPVGGAN